MLILQQESQSQPISCTEEPTDIESHLESQSQGFSCTEEPTEEETALDDQPVSIDNSYTGADFRDVNSDDELSESDIDSLDSSNSYASDCSSSTSEVASHCSENEWAPDNTIFQPLYNGAKMSSFDYHISLIEFTLKHHLTKQGYKDLLVLVARSLPTPNIAVTSEYVMRKYFTEAFETPQVSGHYYCSKCHYLFQSNDSMLQCPNKCNVKQDRFVLCDLAVQLKNKLSGMDEYYLL